MKALSIRQPWAELILCGEKTIEVRSWRTDYRGFFYIHASKKVDRKDADALRMDWRNLPKGKVVGIGELADIVSYDSLDSFIADANKHKSPESVATFYFDPAVPSRLYGFVLRNVKRLEYQFPWKGRLNFFEIPIQPER